MSPLTFKAFLLCLVITSTLSDWVPSNPVSLGTFPSIKDTGLFTCQLKSNNFVSVRRPYNQVGLNHFVWGATGTKSSIRFLEETFILDLLCLENGQYLILTANFFQTYDNFTFSFFYENGSLANSFRMNDTSLQVFYLKVQELTDSTLIVYSPQPSDKNGFTGFMYLMTHTGTILKRKEIAFNIPPTASQHNNPSEYAYIKAIGDGNGKVILAMSCADWEKDLSQSTTAYFPKRIYYNISILDQNLDTVTGPVKTYAAKFGQNFRVQIQGNDKIAFTIGDRTNKYMNVTVFSSQLAQVWSDSIYAANTEYYMFDHSTPVGNDGFLVCGQSAFNLYWQKYFANGTRSGPLVTVGNNYKLLGTVRLNEENDFGLVYYNLGGNEVFYTKGLPFREVVNSGSVLKVCIALLAFLVLLL